MILHHFVNGPCGASKRLLGVCAIAVALLLPGCFPAPLRVANPVNEKVVDAETGLPIAGASVVHIVCDIHDPDCRDATLLRTATRPDGVLTIDGRRQWGIWISAPGGLPVSVHFTAIWAEGYSAFVRGDYRATVHNLQRRVQRQDLIEALESIPDVLSSSEPSLNPVGSLRRATIRLQPVTP